MENVPKFSSSGEEAEYWKQLAQQYHQNLTEVREELDEFQISSRELEAELEAQLEQQEGKSKDLQSTNQRLQMELESLRERYEQQHTFGHKQLSELQDQVATERGHRQELQTYVRQLEQCNDDLERSKRATVVSLEDFEARLNQAIERNAFLESELEERETLVVTVQRLKDEARDLKQELAVKEVITPHEVNMAADPSLPAPTPPTTTALTEELPPPTTKTTALMNGTTASLTPSVRISALNIVGDLLRKVGTLESKLASCRNVYSQNGTPQQGTKNGPTSPVTSPRAKRLHRGVTPPLATTSLSQNPAQQTPPFSDRANNNVYMV